MDRISRVGRIFATIIGVGRNNGGGGRVAYIGYCRQCKRCYTGTNRPAAGRHELLELDVADYLPWESSKALPLVQKACEKLDQGKRVVLASGYQPSAVERAKETGAKLGLTPVQVSESIAEILGWIGERILREKPVAGVILTGGDTAVSVCRALGVTGIRILEEVVPAIPLGEMKTDDGKLLRVVTKAGAFGNADALVIATRRLQKRK